MKNFIKKTVLIFVLGLTLIMPVSVFADSWSGYYDSYDGYYDDSSSYSGYYDDGYDSWSGYYDDSYDSFSGYYDDGYDSWSGYYDDGYDSWSGYYDYPDYGYNYPDYGDDYYYPDYGGNYDYPDYGYNYDNYDYWYDYDNYDYDYWYDDDYYCQAIGCQNPNPPVEPPRPYDLDVVCTVSDRSIERGQSVTFTATANGGQGAYTYRWSGAGLAGKTTRIVSNVFNVEGSYTATVRVTDRDGQVATANCASVQVEDNTPIYDPIDVICTVSDRNIQRGDSVVFTANANGGRGAYTYNWSGDVSGSTRTITKIFNTRGTFYGTVRVTDQDGRSATANCASVRVEEDTPTYDPINVACVVSDQYVEEGSNVIFTANATGGRGAYTYNWSGDVSGATRSISRVFNTSGMYYATVRVTDSDGRSGTAHCDSVQVDDDTPIYDPIDVICTVSDRTIEAGDSVTFTANATGGRGAYTYNWSGDVSGSSRSVTERFTSRGTYYGTVRVTDADGRSSTERCDSVIVNEEDEPEDEDFDVVCRVSDTSIEEGDTVRFTAEVDGGDSPYEYRWTGDVDDEDERTFTARFNREGRYEIELEVRDDEGRIARDTCSTVRVDEEEDDDDDDERDRDINVSSGLLSSGGGTLAGVSSVYLNQVPYTGPEDVAKVIAFIVAILVWSMAGALIIKNRMAKKEISNRIAAFKETNKGSQI